MSLDIDDDEEENRFAECVVDSVEFHGDGGDTTIVLKNCITMSGATVPGIHVYTVVNINSLKILKAGDGVKVDTRASPAKTSPTSTSNGRASGKPMGRRLVYRSDNPHLEKLLPLQVNGWGIERSKMHKFWSH